MCHMRVAPPPLHCLHPHYRWQRHGNPQWRNINVWCSTSQSAEPRFPAWWQVTVISLLSVSCLPFPLLLCCLRNPVYDAFVLIPAAAVQFMATALMNEDESDTTHCGILLLLNRHLYVWSRLTSHHLHMSALQQNKFPLMCSTLKVKVI